jgi:hypothetical protein
MVPPAWALGILGALLGAALGLALWLKSIDMSL